MGSELTLAKRMAGKQRTSDQPFLQLRRGNEEISA
jgi:hypothetical protein